MAPGLARNGWALALRGRAADRCASHTSGRYIVGDYDGLYEITEGAWYGWPDFASGIRLDDPYWGEGVDTPAIRGDAR